MSALQRPKSSSGGAYTVKQLAELMSVSEATVRQWIGTGNLRAVKLDGSNRQPIIRVLRDDWERYLASKMTREA